MFVKDWNQVKDGYVKYSNNKHKNIENLVYNFSIFIF